MEEKWVVFGQRWWESTSRPREVGGRFFFIKNDSYQELRTVRARICPCLLKRVAESGWFCGERPLAGEKEIGDVAMREKKERKKKEKEKKEKEKEREREKRKRKKKNWGRVCVVKKRFLFL